MKLSTVTKDFDLKNDPDGEAKITVKQANFGASAEREELSARIRWVTTGEIAGEMAAEQHRNFMKVWVKELYFTLMAASGFMNEDNEELFKFRNKPNSLGIYLDMSETQFWNAVASLPYEIVEEMHDAVLNVNPQWDPNRQGED